MVRVSIVVAGALLMATASPRVAAAQSPARQFSVLVGVGNSLGWLGGSGEAYLGSGRVSVFAGLGYTPAIDDGDPSGATFAGGLRAYTGGSRHRGYLEAGVAQIAIDSPGDPSIDAKRHYGPMAMIGYQHVGGSGFTQMLGLGLGYIANSDDLVDQSVQPVFTLGLGYTW